MAITYNPATDMYYQDGVPISSPGQLGGQIAGTTPVQGVRTVVTSPGEYHLEPIATPSVYPLMPLEEISPGVTFPSGIFPGVTYPSGRVTNGLGTVLPVGLTNGLGTVLPVGLTNGLGRLEDLPIPAPLTTQVGLTYQTLGLTTTPTHADVVPGQLGIVNGVPVSGPGVPEPPRAMVAREWSIAVHSNKYGTFRMYFWRLIDGRHMSHNPATKGWHIWRPKKMIVISPDPKMSTLRKLNRLNRRVAKMLAPYTKTRTKVVTGRGRHVLSPLERKVLEAAGG